MSHYHTNVLLGTEVFKNVIASNRFIYYKDTSKSLESIKAKLEVVKNANSNFEFYDAHSPNAMYSLQMGAKGMSSISGNFYPEILVWMVNNATNQIKEEVKWLQSEISRVDPLIHEAYPMSAKYFLRKRGLPVRTISRATALELTPEQKKILDEVHDSFKTWCERLDIKPVDIEALMLPKYPLDAAI